LGWCAGGRGRGSHGLTGWTVGRRREGKPPPWRARLPSQGRYASLFKQRRLPLCRVRETMPEGEEGVKKSEQQHEEGEGEREAGKSFPHLQYLYC